MEGSFLLSVCFAFHRGKEGSKVSISLQIQLYTYIQQTRTIKKLTIKKMGKFRFSEFKYLASSKQQTRNFIPCVLNLISDLKSNNHSYNNIIGSSDMET